MTPLVLVRSQAAVFENFLLYTEVVRFVTLLSTT